MVRARLTERQVGSQGSGWVRTLWAERNRALSCWGGQRAGWAELGGWEELGPWRREAREASGRLQEGSAWASEPQGDGPREVCPRHPSPGSPLPLRRSARPYGWSSSLVAPSGASPSEPHPSQGLILALSPTPLPTPPAALAWLSPQQLLCPHSVFRAPLPPDSQRPHGSVLPHTAFSACCHFPLLTSNPPSFLLSLENSVWVLPPHPSPSPGQPAPRQAGPRSAPRHVYVERLSSASWCLSGEPEFRGN